MVIVNNVGCLVLFMYFVTVFLWGLFRAGYDDWVILPLSFFNGFAALYFGIALVNILIAV